jgi:hypothetical protein
MIDLSHKPERDQRTEGKKMTKTATTAKTADILEHAVNNAVTEFNLNVKAYMNFYYVWTASQKGVAQRDGFDYLREGVFIFIDDTQVVIRQVVDHAMNAGEIKLSGFATRQLELIQGAIETALEF